MQRVTLSRMDFLILKICSRLLRGRGGSLNRAYLKAVIRGKIKLVFICYPSVLFENLVTFNVGVASKFKGFSPK